MKIPSRHVVDAHKEILTIKDGLYKIYGGYGNRLIGEVKVENGKHFRRCSDQSGWENINIAERISQMLSENRVKDSKGKGIFRRLHKLLKF